MNASCVVVLPVRAFGGHEKMLVEWLSSAVSRHGLRVQIFSAPNGRLIKACEAAGLGPPVICYPDRADSLRDFCVTWRLLAEIPRRVPVLFAPGVVQAAPLQWLAAFLRRRRVTGYVPMAYSARQMHMRGGRLRDWLIRQVVRHVDLWITVTRRQRSLLRQLWRVRGPVVVVPNRLALLADDAPPARHDAQGRLRVLFAGRFEPHQKGLDWLCERLRAAPEEWTGRVHFTFRGEGPFRAELVRLAGEVGPHHVRVQPWGDVGEAMGEADVLLLPSRFEGLPLVALEAIHFGVPVLASHDAGVAEFVAPSCLFDFGDHGAMWTALYRLEDPAQRVAVVAHARRRVDRLISAASFEREIAQIVGTLEAAR